MKFTWKMISLVTVLLALSLSMGGFLVIHSTFQMQLSTEISDAQNDIKLFSISLQALYYRELEENPDGTLEERLHQVLLSSSVFEDDEYRISYEDGHALLQSQHMVTPEVFPQEAGILETRIVQQGALHYILSTEKLLLSETPLYISRCREVTALYRQSQENLRQFQLLMVVILAVGVAITTAMTIYLTRPIRRISRTARQLSAGRYDKRVNVHSKDELGLLAQDFNRMADALEQQIHQLADAAQRQKDFTASFAHELKTPLTSVIGYADTLRSRRLPPELQMEAADYIFSEGKRLESMSFALLDLFALEQETPEFRQVSPALLAAQAQKSMGYLLGQSGVELTVDVEDVPIQAAPELMVTLLYNLMDNARKAMEPGGVMTLTGRRRPDGYWFCLEDTGRGIPPEALERITEPFYMVDKSRSRAQGGAGLGLALCRRIAVLHGSDLHFTSQVGKGTRVEWTLGGDAV